MKRIFFLMLLFGIIFLSMTVAGSVASEEPIPDETPNLENPSIEEPGNTGMETGGMTTGSEYGWIDISSSPQGAQLTFDGETQGTTPAQVQVHTTGTPHHEIRLNLNGYQEWGTTLNINPQPGQTIPISATLIPITPEPTITIEPTITVQPTIGGDYGWFDITSSPSGAQLSFDGEIQGTTPAQVQVYSTGTPDHEVRLSMDGYLEWGTTLNINPQPGQTIPISATLIPITPTPTITIEPTITVQPTIGGDYGWFYITSSPSGADLFVDNTFRGATPGQVRILTTGSPSHSILIRMNGYYDWTKSINQNPMPGQTIPIQASLVPVQTTGKITVTSSPSGAVAILDGGTQMITPCTFTQVQPGVHSIQVSIAGYIPYSKQVRVSSAGTSAVTATLTPSSNYGSLMVSSTPAGADILLDGIYKGESPLVIGSVYTGIHDLTLKLSGYQIWQTSVSVSAGVQTPVTATMRPLPQQTGSIQVASSPSGSFVYLNSEYIGITPDNGYLDIPNLAPGSYQVYITHPHNEDYTEAVTVTAGQTNTMYVTLPAANPPESVEGSLSVSSNPAGAEVLVDNVYKGITPLTLNALNPGTYTVTLTMQGYQSYSAQVTITGGKNSQVNAELNLLQPTPTQIPPTTQPTQTSNPLIGILFGIIGGVFLLKRR